MTDKLKMHSLNKADENYQALVKLFPNAVTETIVGYDEENKPIIERAIDVDVLRQEISTTVVEGRDERYQFTWPDKKKAILAANAPIAKTLRPCREESVDFDSSENLYIEGDNLDVLKLLQETYLGKIKMIYIDPPYNTGNDFIYEDDFAENANQYLSRSGQYDDEGNRLFHNTDSNGRFHTDWLNMIYPRIKLAKTLLRDDGVIFISIDDYEVNNIKKICDEIFGEQNCIGTVIWERAFSPKNDAKYFSASHDYILVYAKSSIVFQIGKLPRSAETDARYKNTDNDPRGAWVSGDLTVKTYSASYDYPITVPSGRVVSPSHGSCWRVSKEKFDELVKDNRIWFGATGDNVPRLKRFLSEVQDGMTPTTLWKYTEVGHNQEGRQELKKLFDGKGYFDGPKPIRLLKRIFNIANLQNNDLVLDFFSGSATTGHALMEYNIENNKACKYIMVQLPEVIDNKSDPYKDGYETICDIGKERLRLAIKQIKGTDTNQKNGFRVLKLDSSNMKDVYYNPVDYQQTLFDSLTDNIKPDRTPEDLLFQVMLDLGVLLSSKIDTIEIAGKNVFSVEDDYLIACFDDNVTEEVVKEIAQRQPFYAVFRDSSITNDSLATNFEQIFETYSPTTVRKVL